MQEKRRPEGELHTWNRARTLHARVRPSPVIAAQSTLHRDLDTAGLKRVSLRAVLRLLMQIEDSEARAIVLSAASDRAFILLPSQLQHALLVAMKQAIAD